MFVLYLSQAEFGFLKGKYKLEELEKSFAFFYKYETCPDPASLNLCEQELLKQGKEEKRIGSSKGLPSATCTRCGAKHRPLRRSGRLPKIARMCQGCTASVDRSFSEAAADAYCRYQEQVQQ